MNRIKTKPLLFLVVSVLGVLAATLVIAYWLSNAAPPTLVRAGIHCVIPRNPPITVSFLSLSNEANGTRVVLLSMLNHTKKPVEYTADASSQPRYDVLQLTGVSTNVSQENGRTVYRVCHNITNHNASAPRGAVKWLQPGASATCSVRIPPGVTNEIVLLHYFPRRTLADMLRSIGRATRLSVPVRQFEESYPVWEPFEGAGKW